MEDKRITFETAKLAKQKGFNILVPKVWYEDAFNKHDTRTTFGTGLQEGVYLQPTQSLLQKWLREVHKIDITIEIIGADSYGYYIHKNRNLMNRDDKVVEVKISPDNYKKHYEDCLEKALYEAILIIQK